MRTATAIDILLVDDEPFMLKLLSHMLNKLDFTAVRTATSGEEALQEIVSTNTQPNLIMLDLNMPKMDGIEFIRKLTKTQFKGSLIFVTGEGARIVKTVEKLATSHQIQVLGHLLKPVTQQALQAIVKTWTASEKKTPSKPDKKAYRASELHRAINNGELINYYQPKVDVSTGHTIGVEALVRWQHPVDGIVYPDEFISLAEKHGLINELTFAVLSEALNQANLWREAGIALQIAVNVSMDNLVSLDFPDVVAELTEKSGVPNHNVILEITESSLMQDAGLVLDILTRLRLKRFGLSIDDFGTGHSSLRQLHDIPFDQLKIDQSFVGSACSDPAALAIYTASLKLGKQLGMEVVAEGVETREDWELLLRTKCDIAQGYFIARPMPAADLGSWMAEWQLRVDQQLYKKGGTQRAEHHPVAM
ncbi:MAG: EAL domain-containing protein (putative c-di-GMP-specific phosphodiesterase class I) [Halieaceae bacterium]|jgi:EAL domain-containing protein (putative c-di-GMP-specific phosphodiesterase class I)/CheY-like chemotaxis protein